MSPIRTRVEAEKWLEKRLREEGPGLWREAERKELAGRLADDYRTGQTKWRVKQWMEDPEGAPLYVVTRGEGIVGIFTVNDDHKADAIMRGLNALDAEMRLAGHLVDS